MVKRSRSLSHLALGTVVVGGLLATLIAPADAMKIGRKGDRVYRIDNPVSFGAHGAGWIELPLRHKQYRYANREDIPK
jgi:hypothetical protein